MEAERPNEPDSTPSQVKIDAMLEEVEERNKVDVRGKQADGGTKWNHHGQKKHYFALIVLL